MEWITGTVHQLLVLHNERFHGVNLKQHQFRTVIYRLH